MNSEYGTTFSLFLSLLNGNNLLSEKSLPYMIFILLQLARPGRTKTKWPLGSRALYKEKDGNQQGWK